MIIRPLEVFYIRGPESDWVQHYDTLWVLEFITFGVSGVKVVCPRTEKEFWTRMEYLGFDRVNG